MSILPDSSFKLSFSQVPNCQVQHHPTAQSMPILVYTPNPPIQSKVLFWPIQSVGTLWLDRRFSVGSHGSQPQTQPFEVEKALSTAFGPLARPMDVFRWVGYSSEHGSAPKRYIALPLLNQIDQIGIGSGSCRPLVRGGIRGSGSGDKCCRSDWEGIRVTLSRFPVAPLAQNRDQARFWGSDAKKNQNPVRDDPEAL